jgi:hypothetical protein
MRATVSFELGQNFSFDEVELPRRGFGKSPEFGAYVADAGTGSLAGMAVHYEMPFMHSLQPLLMLKWLYVDPECGGGRVGQRLMRQWPCTPVRQLWRSQPCTRKRRPKSALHSRTTRPPNGGNAESYGRSSFPRGLPSGQTRQ